MLFYDFDFRQGLARKWRNIYKFYIFAGFALFIFKETLIKTKIDLYFEETFLNSVFFVPTFCFVQPIF